LNPLNYQKSNPGIRFAAGEELQFFSTLRQRVEDYFESSGISQKANAAMVIKTVVLLLAYLVPFFLILFVEMSFMLQLLCWTTIGIALAGIGMSVMHDANHGAYSSDERVNKIIGLSLNLLGGTVQNWKYQHNLLHHTYTNISGLDEDIDTKLIIRLSPHSEVKPIHRHQWYYAFFLYAILTLYWGLFKDLVQYIQYKRSGVNRNDQSSNLWWLVRVTVMKLSYFFIAVGLPIIVGLIWWQVVLGFLLMHVVAGLILSVVFQMAHTVEETEFPVPDASGNLENSWAVHQMKTTMNFARGNKWLSWYVGGLNYQVEHHLFTRICHVHYPAISEIVKKTASEFGVPYLEKKTFWEAFKSHVGLLKKHGAPALSEIGG
jgi:linoleoyl-CoA desaturase